MAPRHLGALVGMLLLATSPVFAQHHPSPPLPGTKLPGDLHTQPSGHLLLTRILSPAQPQRLAEHVARDFVRRWEHLLPFEASQLRHLHTRAHLGAVHVSFAQHHGGLPVADRRLVLTLSQDHRVTRLSTNFARIEALERGTLTRARAQALLPAPAHAHQAVWMALGTSGKALLVHEFIVSGHEPYARRVRIDSRDGRIISAQPLATKD